MTGVRLHHSNRMEALAAELARLMRADPGDPFAPERIVVQHPTIGRWLSLELARGLGIAANVRFELPAEFAWSIMRDADPDLSGDRTYAPERLRWRIHDVLPELAEGPEARAVRGYLGDGDPRKRFELADRLARVFDRCLLYRPDWIREWERGAVPHWQARLWRRLVGEGQGAAAAHWVAAIDAFHERIGSDARPSGWPRRAAFFAVSSLSPSYLDVLRRAAEGIEIHLFMLVPCREYWGDIRSRREVARRDGGGDPDAGYFTEGNELLAAWGRAGRDTFDALVEGESVEWEEHFVPPDGACRLAAVQRDILDLRLASEAAQIEAAAPEDAPVQGPAADAPAETPSERTSSTGVPEGPPSAHVPSAGLPVEAASAHVPSAGLPVEAASAHVPSAGLPVEAASAHVPSADLPVEAASAHVPSAGLPVEAASAHVPSAGAQEGGQGQWPPAGDSIQIHVCHSPLREAEVLHDRLLALFDTHTDLEPADVLVLTPNLAVYGPAVEAVFGAAGCIPCNVARVEGASRTLRAFLDLLALPRSRHGAESMLAPLAAPAVRTRFGIEESDLAAVRALVREAGIRWGVDETHRGEEGLPETPGHTWRQGLRRLLLGYAMEGTDVLVAGLAPCSFGADGVGTGEVDGGLLGGFVSYCEGVFGLRDRLAGERRPARWAAELRAVVRDFFPDVSGSARGAGGAGGSGRNDGTGRIGHTGGRPSAGELADEVGAVRALIRGFEREAEHAESPVPFEVVLDVLRERACETVREPARLADGVTVASLGAGRIYPAGIVCLIGMNDGAFPRLDPVPSFDLVAAGPVRRGDRDVRHEDRFAFLEALLAARRCFLVTFAGRGPRDDAPIPPSVPVDELKDYLGRRFPGAAVETRHPLQPFSPRYFAAGTRAADGAGNGMGGGAAGRAVGGVPDHAPEETASDGSPGGGSPDGEDLFSYSRGMCEAAKAMQAGGEGIGAPGRFAVAPPDPEESRRCIALADLVAFFANPARFFLRERLGARLESGDAALDEEEPFEIDGLERYRLRSETWEQVRAGAPPERTAALLRGRGRLPHAGLGHIAHERAREEAEQLEQRLARYRAALEAPPREVDFELGGFRITGAVGHVGPEGSEPGKAGSGGAMSGGAGSGTLGPVRMVWWRLGSLRARDRIEIGLRQLAWAAAGHKPVGAVAVSLEKGSWTSAELPPPDRAGEQLERWLRAWWQGLGSPLPFFPEASLAYAKAVARAGDDGIGALETARAKAHDAWFGSRYRRGERLDPYLGLIHDGPDPLAGEFEDLAKALLVPLVAGAGR